MILRRIGLGLAVVLGGVVVGNLLFWGYKSIRGAFSEDPMRDLPPVMLWAWERPEDLRFLDCNEAGVAYQAGTVTLGEEGPELRPRMQSLHAPDGCAVVGVVRIEAPPGDPTVSPEGIAAEVMELVPAGRVEALQVDFDATTSQRPFYRALLKNLRKRLPPEVRLSMTALASWCIHDRWISGLPVDEAVPMLFRMGVDDHEVRRYLNSGNDFLTPACRWSVGLSTDESVPRLPPRRRRYVFHPRSWAPESAGIALRESWQ